MWLIASKYQRISVEKIIVDELKIHFANHRVHNIIIT